MEKIFKEKLFLSYDFKKGEFKGYFSLGNSDLYLETSKPVGDVQILLWVKSVLCVSENQFGSF